MSINFWKIAQGINLAPKTSAPSSPVNGDMYYNSTTNLFQFYQNGAFVGTGGDVSQNGNSFGTTMTIGTNDANTLAFETNNVTKGSVTSAGLWTLGAASGTQIHNINGAELDLTPSTASSDFTLQHGQQQGRLILSSDNRGFSTRGGSIALYGNGHATQADNLEFYRAGVLSFKISSSGGNPFLATTGKMNISGTIGIGGVDTAIAIETIGSANPLTNSRQWGSLTELTATSAATHATLAIVGFYAANTTAATAFTAPNRYGFYNDNTTKGAGSTITTDIAYGGITPSQGTTGNAMFSDASTLTGNYFFYSTSGNESLLSGRWLTLNANSAGDAGLLIYNLNNGSGANAEIEIQSNSTAAGDAKVRFNISGGASWATGVDNSDGDNYKISASGNVGTSDVVTLNTSGLIGLTGAIDTNTLVNVLNNGALTGTSQRGITVGFSGSSGATAEVTGYRSEVGTTAAAFTTAQRVQFHARSITKGAGSTITRDIKYFTDGATSQGSSNAQFADNTGFSGDYSFHFNDTREARFAGRLSAGGDGVASTLVTSGGGTNPMTQTNQRAYGSFLTSTSAATDSTEGYYGSVTTAAAAYTTTFRAQFNATNPTKGSGSTITRDVNYLGTQSTQGTTGNAFLADNTAFSGSFFINQSGTNASSFGGKILHPDGASNAPSISFSSQTTLGFYKVGTDSVRFVGSDDLFFGIWNAGTNDASVLVLENNGSSTGDQYVWFKEGGSTGDQWSVGRDDSDSGAFVISQNSSPGTNNFLKITTVGNVITAGALAQTSYDTATPTTGQTVTASANKPGVLITPAGTLATLTIKLPSSPIDGQRYWVASSQQLTSVTWQDAGGTAGNVIGGQTTIGGTNRSQEFVYSLANTKWYAIS